MCIAILYNTSQINQAGFERKEWWIEVKFKYKNLFV